MRWLPLVAVLVFVAPAGAKPSYTLIGAGSAPLRDGAPAGDARLDGASAIASRSDGVFAFATQGRVFWVEHGVLSRVRVPVADQLDVAFAADGTLVVSTCPGSYQRSPSAVWRAARGHPPTLLAGDPRRRGSSGDGGPATAARLRCPVAVDVQPDGGVLIADSGANRIRRVAADGTIATVAGTGRDASDGDGGPAVRAAVLPTDVAALPGGGFAIADLGPRSLSPFGGRTIDKSVVRVVGPDGVIRTRSTHRADQIAAEPSGDLLMVDVAAEDGHVHRLAPDGRVSVVTDLRRDAVGIPPYLQIAGDPFVPGDSVVTETVAAAADGGVLYAADYAIQYVPPARPALLAVAILPATRVPAPGLTVAVRSTRPAALRVDLLARGRLAASVAADAPGGDVSVPIGAAARPGLYTVRVRAQGDGQVATAEADVLVGGLLPVSYVRRFVRSRVELFRVLQDGGHFALRCRRMTRRRVDCGVIKRRRCSAVVTMRVRALGTLSVRHYHGGRGRRCRFRR